jgi:hypothetical protein
MCGFYQYVFGVVSPLQKLNVPFPIEMAELGKMVFLHPEISVLEDASIIALHFLRLS